MKSSALKHTKDVLVKYLKAYLRNYENYSNYCQKNYSHSDVYDKEPNVLRVFPTIIITGSSGQVITSGLSDFARELYDEDGDFKGYLYSGMYEFSISIDIGTRSTLDREVLTDLVTMALRFHLRRYMESKGVLVKDIRYGSESEVPYDTDKIYVSNIQLTTWSEWSQEVNFLPLEDIDIDIEMK